MTSFPRGSEWRRWDLHVHTPASALNNSFGSWDDYIGQVEAQGKDVSVVGFTDYCSIDGYKKALEYKVKGRLKQFDLLLPNIEFRITPELPDGGAINVHLLVSPEDPDHVRKIEFALRKLKFTYDGTPYSCATDELIALGKAHKPGAKEDGPNFKAGVNAFKPSFDTFRDWLNGNAWLKDNSLVVISNGKDGASGLSKDAGFSATRNEIYRLSDMIFSANPKDREYFLGLGSDTLEKVIEEKGSSKPCVHGSDAHAGDKLFTPVKDRFCWVKANPTFEGLRQVVHEPADRVHIGASHPAPADISRIIDRVELTGLDSWFSKASVELNSGLVAIIGEKGSGKTALADLIAFACGAWNGESSASSFIWKARNFLEGGGTKAVWGDGTASLATLVEKKKGGQPRVRYLSQDFVEQLCSQDFKGEKLVAEVEEVVFTHIDEEDRYCRRSRRQLFGPLGCPTHRPSAHHR